MTTMKICRRCGTEKILEQFSKHKKCKDGYQGTCLECTANITAAWVKANPERKALNNSNYEKMHPVRKSISRRRRQQLEPYRVSIEEMEHNMINRYGVTLEEYGHMFNDQNGNCKTCKYSHKEFARGLVIDHNHTTGKVRGLLCDPCNRAIGYLKENVQTLNSIIDYLNQDPSI